ncbi:hypothetical protein ACWGBO_31220 [[Kitasatospora] papulosa]
MKPLAPAGAVLAATLVLTAAPVAQASDGTGDDAGSSILQKIVDHPVALLNNGNNTSSGNAGGSVVN